MSLSDQEIADLVEAMEVLRRQSMFYSQIARLERLIGRFKYGAIADGEGDGGKMSEQDCVPERAGIKWLEGQLDIARDNERLHAALGQIRLDCLSYATQHVGMARDQFIRTADDAERAPEQKGVTRMPNCPYGVCKMMNCVREALERDGYTLKDGQLVKGTHRPSGQKAD